MNNWCSFDHWGFDYNWLYNHWFDIGWLGNVMNHWWFMILSDDGISNNVLVVLIPAFMDMYIFSMVVNDRRLMIRIRLDVGWLMDDYWLDVGWLLDYNWLMVDWLVDYNWLMVDWLVDYNWLDIGWFGNVMNDWWFVVISNNWVTYDVFVIFVPTLMDMYIFSMVVNNRRLVIRIRLYVGLLNNHWLMIDWLMNYNWLDISWRRSVMNS